MTSTPEYSTVEAMDDDQESESKDQTQRHECQPTGSVDGEHEPNGNRPRELDPVTQRMEASLDAFRDDVLEAFNATAEVIRSQLVPADRLAALRERVERIERRLGVKNC